MANITIHLKARTDGSVAVSVRDGSARLDHSASLAAVAAVRKSVAAFMAGFEAGHRPLADLVSLAEVG